MLDSQSLNFANSALLFGTAFVAGGLNAVAGGGSFITFPTLIFTGMPAIAANATNNTALWIATLASAGAYRKALDIPKRQLWLLGGTSLVGGLLGAMILLYTAPAVFQKLIPYLLLSATIVFAFSDLIKKRLKLQSEKSAPPPIQRLMLSQLAISIYGGFFGAGMGILMLATLAFLGIRNIHAMNAFKTLLGSCINGIAIVPFLVAGVIDWPQALLMAIGASLGGYLSAHYAQKLDPKWIRRLVIAVGSGMSVYFFVHG